MTPSAIVTEKGLAGGLRHVGLTPTQNVSLLSMYATVLGIGLEVSVWNVSVGS